MTIVFASLLLSALAPTREVVLAPPKAIPLSMMVGVGVLIRIRAYTRIPLPILRTRPHQVSISAMKLFQKLEDTQGTSADPSPLAGTLTAAEVLEQRTSLYVPLLT